jgi:hypothetical protein
MARIEVHNKDSTVNEKLAEIGYRNKQVVHQHSTMIVAAKIFNRANLNVSLIHEGTENTIIAII